MRLEPPHGELADVQFHIVKREQQIGVVADLKGIDRIEFRTVQQHDFSSEQIIDAVQPLLKIAAAALNDEPVFAVHPAQFVYTDFFYWHKFIPPACSSASSME